MPDDILQFLCIHRPATLAFGAPAQEARRRVAAMSRMIDASGKSRDYVRQDTEKSLRQNIEGGFHLDPKHQNEITTFVMWLTMTSPAALESPDAQGFAIEFSNSPVSSRRPSDVVVQVIGPGLPKKARKARPKAGRIVHYWTESDGGAVVRLTVIVRQQVGEVRDENAAAIIRAGARGAASSLEPSCPLELSPDVFAALDRAFHAQFPPWRINGKLVPQIRALTDAAVRVCDAYAGSHGLGTASADELTAELTVSLIDALQLLLARLGDIITNSDLPGLTRMQESGIIVDYQLTHDGWLKSRVDAMASVTRSSRAAQDLLADAVGECFGFVLVA